MVKLSRLGVAQVRINREVEDPAEGDLADEKSTAEKKEFQSLVLLLTFLETLLPLEFLVKDEDGVFLDGDTEVGAGGTRRPGVLRGLPRLER